MSGIDLEKQGYLPLASLKDCPVQITLHTDSQIEMIKNTARTDPASIPPVDVAKLSDDDTLIIVDGHARVDALRSFGIERIKANLHNVQNIAEAVILHVRLNQKNHVNPLKFYDAFRFLKDAGYDSKDIPKKLWLNESYSRVLKINLTEKAHTLLERYLDELASKYSIVHLPVYVIESIGKIKEEQDQVEAVKLLVRMIPKNIQEFKQGFPSFDELEIAFSSFQKAAKQRDPTIFSFKDDNKTENSSDKSTGHKKTTKPARMTHSKEEIDEAKELIGSAAHRALLKCPHGTKFIVDMKDHTISEVKEDDRVISIGGDCSEPIFMIPQKHARFLQLNYGDPVYFKSFRTRKQLRVFVEGLEEDQRIVVISSQKI